MYMYEIHIDIDIVFLIAYGCYMYVVLTKFRISMWLRGGVKG